MSLSVRGLAAGVAALVVMVLALVPMFGAAHADPAAGPTSSGAAITLIIPETPGPMTSNGPGSGSGGSGTGNSGNGVAGGGTIPGPTCSSGTPVPPSQPTSGAHQLTLDPERVAATGWMVATGSGFGSGEQVQLVLYPGATVIGSYPADASGGLMVRFRIPEDTRTGLHVAEATGWSSCHAANKEFTVITGAFGGGLPYLWWLYVVVGTLFLGLVSASIYFRRSIAEWFRPTRPAGAAS